MKTETMPNHTELAAEYARGIAGGVTVFRKPDFVGKKADLADRKTRLEELAERAGQAHVRELQAQHNKLEAEREEAIAASIRSQQPLGALREAAERANAEYRAGLSKYEEATAAIPQFDAQIERLRVQAVKASESSPEIDWLNLHIEDLARQAIASKDRDGKFRVQIANAMITTNNSEPAEELQRVYHANPDRRAVIAKALQNA